MADKEEGNVGSEQGRTVGDRADRQEYFTVGVIAGTHALRGEVKVLSRTDFPEKRFKRGSQLYMREAGKEPDRTLTVAASRPHKQFWLVSFDGFTSINEVESWRGRELVVPESDLISLPKDTYYIHQLIGLQVISDDGLTVGTIRDVLKPGANDVYVVRGTLQKNDVLIPAIPDCVLSVDLDKQQMLVHLIPGLLESDEDANSVPRTESDEPDGLSRKGKE